jgi:hypothetical protein
VKPFLIKIHRFYMPPVTVSILGELRVHPPVSDHLDHDQRNDPGDNGVYVTLKNGASILLHEVEMTLVAAVLRFVTLLINGFHLN